MPDLRVKLQIVADARSVPAAANASRRALNGVENSASRLRRTTGALATQNGAANAAARWAARSAREQAAANRRFIPASAGNTP